MAARARFVPLPKAIRWTGKATVRAGERTIEIGVDTQVEPFAQARSTSWLLTDGPAKSRTLLIQRNDSYAERDGQRSPLPPAAGAA